MQMGGVAALPLLLAAVAIAAAGLLATATAQMTVSEMQKRKDDAKVAVRYWRERDAAECVHPFGFAAPLFFFCAR